jgi:hypothetical protein
MLQVWMRRLVAAAGTAALLATPLVATHAQDIPDNASTRSVVSQILSSRNYKNLLDKGYTSSHSPQFNLLNDGAYEDVQYQLEGGYTYYFVGKCDQDCSDLDLKLFDADGEMMDSDLGDDDYPIVTYTPSFTRTFTLRIIMAKCSTTNCWSGVVAVRK